MTDDLRALTVKPPWSWAILLGKDVENRGRPFPSTIDTPAAVLLHSGLSHDDGTEGYILDRVGSGYWHRPLTGAVIGVMLITGSHPAAECEGRCSVWGFPDDPDRPVHHWQIGEVAKLRRPVPAKGKLGLWVPDADLVAAVRDELL